MNRYLLRAEQIKKTFNRKVIFSDISFDLSSTQSLVITGRNGAGKSTLIKIIAALSSPTTGRISAKENEKEINAAVWFQYIGFVAPYLQLYEEFSAWENLRLLSDIRAMKIGDPRLRELLEMVQLDNRRHDIVRTYSSGMKQRLKYACALLHDPIFLLLDEPTANLDVAGRTIVENIVTEQKKSGVVIVATNEPAEIAWCDQTINLDKTDGR
ncbi:MAG: ATP-binding cassette domain-containing protein [Bacteroidota bacterium]